jgi:hypothetical protein
MIDFDRLVGHALGELRETDAAHVDEHVLACGTCASTLEMLLRLRGAVRDVVREGKVAFPVSATLVEALKAAGLISRTYHLVPERALPCAVGIDDIYALTTLDVDLRGVVQLDLVQTTILGSGRVKDVPFDAERGVVMYVTRSDWLRTLPSTRVTLELFAVGASGKASGERKLAQYFLDHKGMAGP